MVHYDKGWWCDVCATAGENTERYWCEACTFDLCGGCAIVAEVLWVMIIQKCGPLTSMTSMLVTGRGSVRGDGGSCA